MRWSAGPNEFEAACRRARAEHGSALLELTDTNPTRHGLLDPRIPEIMARHAKAAAVYDPSPRGPLAAREALAARFGGSPEEYWLCASTSEAYSWLFALLAEPGRLVAAPVPGYPLVEPIARLSGLGIAEYLAHWVGPTGWELDLDSVRDALGAWGPVALVAVSPNNPTGAYLSDFESDEVKRLLAQHGLPLIADEVFHPFALDDAGAGRAGSPHPRLAGSTETTTFALDGLSKLLAAPQLKCSWIRLTGPGSDDLAQGLDMVADTFLSVNGVVAAALPDLLAIADDAVARVRARLAANLATLRDGFPGRVRRTGGGWVALLDTPVHPGADAPPVEQILARQGIIAQPGWLFDVPGANTIAVSLLPAEDGFRANCQRLAGALARAVG